MPQVQVGKHTLEVTNSFWGTETVRYDGKVVAKGYSFLGRSYMFTVEEDGDQVTYEAEFRLALIGGRYTIRRNGVAIFTS